VLSAALLCAHLRGISQTPDVFTHEYLEAIRDELGAHGGFVLAEYKGQVVAATLYLYDETDVFWYLGRRTHLEGN
jgi:hypothetical protein